MKLLRFLAGDVVEAVVYANKMNYFLLKEAAINFIVANANKVQLSGTVKDIPESKGVMQDFLFFVATMNLGGQKRKNNSDDLNHLSLINLRAQLALQGEDVDGSRETLIARLKGAKDDADNADE